MYRLRRWSARHSRTLHLIYTGVESSLLKAAPLLEKIGYERLEKPFMAFEKVTKGLLFDSQSCGQCTLGSTGMSCPMNCPKQLRNGPCGGVCANGNWEVGPDMPCVWVQAWNGSQQMRDNTAILNVQKPVDQSLRETSSWLRVTAKAAADREKQNANAVENGQ